MFWDSKLLNSCCDSIQSGTPALLRWHLFHDRRQFARFDPSAPLLVHLGEYTGLLSNLCEGGLAVKSHIPEILGEVFRLSVELPNRSSTMQALAQITWKSDLKNLTGVQFVHLPDTSRQQVREWMFTQATTTVKELSPIFRVSARNAQLNFAAFHSQLTSGVEPTELEGSRRHAGLHLLTALVLTASTLWTASFTVGL